MPVTTSPRPHFEHSAQVIEQLLGERSRLPNAWTPAGGGEIIDVGPGVVRLRHRRLPAWQGLVCRLSHGMHLVVEEMDPTEAYYIRREGNDEFVLHLLVTGSFELEPTSGEARTPQHGLAGGQVSLSIREHGKVYGLHLPAGKPIRVVTLSCSPETLAGDFNLPGGVERLREVFAVPQVMPLDRGAMKTANEIIATDPASPLGTMLLEGKVLELLGNLMLPWLARAAQKAKPLAVANWQDQQRLATARALVELHLENPLPIVTLAARLATTETKLRRLYRECFGVSISEHRTQLRMARAMKLLQDGLHTVAEVAYLTGYEHHSSFTTAFSSHFGQPPSAVHARTQQGSAAARISS